ncbi:MAG: metal-dependent hydrolase (beta-lactamase superfamily II) [Granulosicoccus sp.]|jgi:metal-dependent hydrolase (beta-lactamase superfamily II)
MNKSVKILKAGSGDSIIVHLDGKNILIDGGASMPYSNNLKVAIQNIVQKGEVIDLVIATHFDEDHINGLYRLLEDIRNGEFSKSLIKEFWFQIPPRITTDKFHSGGTKIGVARGKKLAELLQEFNWNDSNIVASTVPYEFDEKTKFWLLSPSSKLLLSWISKEKRKCFFWEMLFLLLWLIH